MNPHAHARGNQAAFPVARFEAGYDENPPVLSRGFAPGMDLRAWLAGQALAGLCANSELMDQSFQKLANWAVEHADAILEALYPPPPKGYEEES